MKYDAAQKGDRYYVAKPYGSGLLYFAVNPIPHWASIGLFTWTGSFSTARRLAKKVGGGIYPVVLARTEPK
jgi:hypothetical protein